MIKNIQKITLKTIIFSILLFQCSQKVDPTTGEVIRTNPNALERAAEARDKGGGLFGDFNKKSSSSNNYEFASSNVLWRATLKSLDFLPLINADYSGGVIIYDWYSKDLNSNEQIKISIRFLSNELRSDSIQIDAHKKICSEREKCITTKLNDGFAKEIKESILTSARILRTEEERNKIK